MALSPPPSTSAVANGTPSQYRSVGVILAVGSGLLIGSSFVFKKKGLIASQSGSDAVAGEGVAYLKNGMWWIGMSMMILGELCNFGAYAFVEALIVTPLGALSVVICAVLSSIFLKEKLSVFGWIGCFQCIVGSVIIALNGPQEQSVTTIAAFKHLFLAPGFLAYGSVIICIALSIMFFFGPKYGQTNMLWDIAVCSLIGGISVSCTQGLGASIVTSIRGENQFKNWFIYFLLIFVIVTLVTEIVYLNKALAKFNTAMVTPTYYVTFTGCTLVTSIVLYKGLKASITQILTVVLGFLVICSGITLLQMSKVDPTKLTHLDRRTTILLQAAREEVQPLDPDDPEKGIIQASEEPGLDAVRGTFGGLGSIVRARRRQSLAVDNASMRTRSRSGSNATHQGQGRRGAGMSIEGEKEWQNVAGLGVPRFQLHDRPMGGSSPRSSGDNNHGRRHKRRESDGSAIAVRGSTAVGSSERIVEEKKGDDDDDNDDEPLEGIDVAAMLAQQRWAAREGGAASPTSQLEDPRNRTMSIKFVDDNGKTSNYPRVVSPIRNIPPISATPPVAPSITTSRPESPPNFSSYFPQQAQFVASPISERVNSNSGTSPLPLPLPPPRTTSPHPRVSSKLAMSVSLPPTARDTGEEEGITEDEALTDGLDRSSSIPRSSKVESPAPSLTVPSETASQPGTDESGTGTNRASTGGLSAGESLLPRILQKKKGKGTGTGTDTPNPNSKSKPRSKPDSRTSSRKSGGDNTGGTIMP